MLSNLCDSLFPYEHDIYIERILQCSFNMTSSCYASKVGEPLLSNAPQNNDLAIMIVNLIETYGYGLSTSRNFIQFQRQGGLREAVGLFI